MTEVMLQKKIFMCIINKLKFKDNLKNGKRKMKEMRIYKKLEMKNI